MGRAFAICMFAFNRVRTVMVALSLIVLMKTAWILIVPAG
jgi:hypothetical protein